MLEVENAPYFTLDITSAYYKNENYDEILHIIKIHDHIKGRFVAVVNILCEPRKIVSSSGKITTSESIRCSENQIAANSSESDKACVKYVKDYIIDGGWTSIPSGKTVRNFPSKQNGVNITGHILDNSPLRHYLTKDQIETINESIKESIKEKRISERVPALKSNDVKTKIETTGLTQW